MRALVTSCIFALAAGRALAGGLAEPSAPPAVIPAAPASTDWSGAYAGLQFGILTNGDLTSPGGDFTVDGNVYGVFGGYRYDFGQFVVGGEIDYMIGSGDVTDAIGAVTPTDFDRLVRVGVEAGFDAGRALVYATAGYAMIDLGFAAGSTDSSGHFYGVGLDFLATDRVVVGAELLHHRFDDFSGGFVGSDLEVLTVGLNVGFRF